MLTTALWFLTFLVAGAMIVRWFSGYLVDHARRGVTELSALRLDEISFDQFPPKVVRRLDPRRREFLNLGFRELSTHRKFPDRPTYSCILVSPDGEILVEIWVARFRGLALWLTLAAGIQAFSREIRNAPRFSLTTHFDNFRDFETTTAEILKQDEVPGEREYLIVDETIAAAEAVAFHRRAAAAFASKCGLGSPMRVEKREDYIRFEEITANRMAAHLRVVAAELEAAISE